MISSNRGILLSVLFHILIVGSAYVVFPDLKRNVGDVGEVMVVELVNIATRDQHQLLVGMV